MFSQVSVNLFTGGWDGCLSLVPGPFQGVGISGPMSFLGGLDMSMGGSGYVGMFRGRGGYPPIPPSTDI